MFALRRLGNGVVYATFLLRTVDLFLSSLAKFGSEFAGHGLLQLVRVHSVAFGGVHENVVAACGGSLIRRIQQTDFQKQLAEFGLVIFADLLGQKFLRGRRSPSSPLPCVASPESELGYKRGGRSGSRRPSASQLSSTEPKRVGGS